MGPEGGTGGGLRQSSSVGSAPPPVGRVTHSLTHSLHRTDPLCNANARQQRRTGGRADGRTTTLLGWLAPCLSSPSPFGLGRRLRLTRRQSGRGRPHSTSTNSSSPACPLGRGLAAAAAASSRAPLKPQLDCCHYTTLTEHSELSGCRRRPLPPPGGAPAQLRPGPRGRPPPRSLSIRVAFLLTDE